jgi:hypothetical protein
MTGRSPQSVPLHRRTNKTQFNSGLYSPLDESWGFGQSVASLVTKRVGYLDPAFAC